MLVFTGTLLAAGILFLVTAKGFLPAEDTGQIFAITEGAQDISFDSMLAKQLALHRIALKNPHVEGAMAVIGSGGSTQLMNQGRMLMNLTPAAERPDADAVITELQAKMQDVPGIRVYLQNLPVIRIGGRLTKSQYQHTPGTATTRATIIRMITVTAMRTAITITAIARTRTASASPHC